MILNGNNVSVVPLSKDAIKLLLSDVDLFEQKYNCVYDGECLNGIFKKLLQLSYQKLLQDEGNYFFKTICVIMRKSDNTIVGSACFKTIPNEDKETEIGYGLNTEYCGNGYMTECVQLMCSYAFENGVDGVIAETNKDNIKSQNVLKRCGFKKYKENDSIFWRYDKNSIK